MFQAALQKALTFFSQRGFNRQLRQEQKSSVKQLFTGGDLLAALPTGFGKSLIFQLLALVNDDHVVLVICPLKSIVNDEIKEASSMGISMGRPPSGRLPMFIYWSILSLFSFSDA